MCPPYRRSAPARDDLKLAPWRGPRENVKAYLPAPTGASRQRINKAHNGHRYVQYRAIMRSVVKNAPVSPVLDRIEIHLR